MNRIRKTFGMNIGTSSVLLIFIILSLVCFASLSLSSAIADQKLTQKAADKTVSYIEAQNLAQVKLSEIDSMLARTYKASADEDAYFASLSGNISYEVTISDTQTLRIEVEPLYPQSAEDAFFRIVRWQTVTEIDEAAYEGTLNVIP